MAHRRQRPKPRVLLADDHIPVVEGLKALLREECDVVGTAHDGRTLVESAGRLRPDVIVTDISMPLMNGVEAIRQICAALPRSRIVVMTMHRDTQLAVDAFRAGASGYLLKTSSGEELLEAIQEVADGGTYVTSLLSKDAITIRLEAQNRESAESGSPLTVRQREVVQLVAEGRTMKEIASILNISPRTVESHKYDVMQALGLQNTAELVQYAVRLGLIAE